MSVLFFSIEYCNFDSGSLCDFTQATGDQFDWTLHKGPTRSGGTGPSTDMSGKGQLFDYPILEGFLLVEIRQARRVAKKCFESILSLILQHSQIPTAGSIRSVDYWPIL